MIRAASLGFCSVCLLPRQNLEHPGRAQMPFRDEAVRGKRAMQRAGRNSIGVGQVTPGNRAQTHEIEVGILCNKRIEGPLDEADPARQGVFPLK